MLQKQLSNLIEKLQTVNEELKKQPHAIPLYKELTKNLLSNGLLELLDDNRTKEVVTETKPEISELTPAADAMELTPICEEKDLSVAQPKETIASDKPTEISQPIETRVLQKEDDSHVSSVNPGISSNRNSLLNMIDLNQGFMLRNELFNGDNELFVRVVKELDGIKLKANCLQRLNEIKKQYNFWLKNEDAVNLLDELIERKFT